MAKYLNLGIVAHVDAGKTSLTERLLYAAGVIDEVGSVDAGNTQTDSMALERARGITIRSAVASFAINDVTVNLIDTPGHPDFIAEVERVLNVLDGAVLVVSAVEGVQAQTRVLMRTLTRLGIPTIVFVNKIDRGGARFEPVLRDIAEKLTPHVVAMGSASQLGTSAATFSPSTAGDPAFRTRLVDLLTVHDDELLAACVTAEQTVTSRRLHDALAMQTARSLAHPVFAGSAITGAGTDALADGITALLPHTSDVAVDGPAAGTVFKVERGGAGEKIAYVRMFAGRLHVRERVPFGQGHEAKVTALRVFDRGTTIEQGSAAAGQIVKVWGLGEVQIGDSIGHFHDDSDEHYFAPPTLETVIEPTDPSRRGKLHVALTQLAEQDPLINVRQDDVRQEISVSLYGEVQKQVIEATLATEYGIDVGFHQTTVLCIERPVATGAAVDFMGQAGNPFRATVGLRVAPAPVGSGVRFELEIELGSLPYSFVRAVEQTVYETLRQGLFGWQVTDCTVTITHSAYVPPPPYGWSKFSSSAGDFRQLTPLVLMDALARAGTTVYEPVHRFRLEIPVDTLDTVIPALNGLRAFTRTQEQQGPSYVLIGDVPAIRVHALRQRLPALTRGEGVLECGFDTYQPVREAPPTRPRTDTNPLNRQEYLLRVAHRV